MPTDVDVAALADVLSEKAFTDKDVLLKQSLKTIIWPTTRPLLESIAAQMNDRLVEFMTVAKDATWRDTFDNSRIRLRPGLPELLARVCVGLNDDQGKLNRCLVWGLSAWGSKSEPYARVLKSLQTPAVALRVVHPKFGRATTLLFKSLTAPELAMWAYHADELAEQIAWDLTFLITRFENAVSSGRK
jgi:hypothetical protein